MNIDEMLDCINFNHKSLRILSERKLEEIKPATHMPFLAKRYNAKNVGPVLFYAFSDYVNKYKVRVWKLYYLDENGDSHRLTKLGDKVSECSPTAWEDESGWHISFIKDNSFILGLNGPTLSELKKPENRIPSRAGFIGEYRSVWFKAPSLIYIREPEKKTKLMSFSLDFSVSRVSYDSEHPEVLLISGQKVDTAEILVFQYDLNTSEQFFLRDDNRPAYKCALFDNNMIYADLSGEEFEDREIVKSDKIIRTVSDIIKVSELVSFDESKF